MVVVVLGLMDITALLEVWVDTIATRHIENITCIAIELRGFRGLDVGMMSLDIGVGTIVFRTYFQIPYVFFVFSVSDD